MKTFNRWRIQDFRKQRVQVLGGRQTSPGLGRYGLWWKILRREKTDLKKKNAAQGGSGGIAPPSAPPLDRPLFDIKYDAKLIIPVGSLTASRSSEWKIFRC